MMKLRLILMVVLTAAANVAIIPADKALASSGLFLHLLIIPLIHLQVSALVIGTIRYLTRKSCPPS